MLNVAVHRTLVLQPSHLTSFMSVPVLVNISVPNPPLCHYKLSLQLDLDGVPVPFQTAVTKSLCSGLVPAKHGAVHIHVTLSWFSSITVTVPSDCLSVQPLYCLPHTGVERKYKTGNLYQKFSSQISLKWKTKYKSI